MVNNKSKLLMDLMMYMYCKLAIYLYIKVRCLKRSQRGKVQRHEDDG